MLPVIENELAPFEVRPHWGKLFTVESRHLQSRYDKLTDFKDLLKAHDPRREVPKRFPDQNSLRLTRVLDIRDILGGNTPRARARHGPLESRVAEGQSYLPPPPSSNRTDGFPVSGFTDLSHSKACAGSLAKIVTRAAGRAAATWHRLSLPPQFGRGVDSDVADDDPIVCRHTSSTGGTPNGDNRVDSTDSSSSSSG